VRVPPHEFFDLEGALLGGHERGVQFQIVDPVPVDAISLALRLTLLAVAARQLPPAQLFQGAMPTTRLLPAAARAAMEWWKPDSIRLNSGCHSGEPGSPKMSRSGIMSSKLSMGTCR